MPEHALRDFGRPLGAVAYWDNAMNGVEEALGVETAPAMHAYAEHQLAYIADPAKEESRRRIADHFLRCRARLHHLSKRRRVLTFPGLRWQFERLLHGEDQSYSFVGVERDTRVFLRSAQWMLPDRGRTDMHDDAFSDQCKLTWAERGENKLVLSNASNFFRYRRTRAMSNEVGCRWSSTFRYLHAAWLDFTSQLCSEVEVCLQELAGALDPHCEVVPFAVTLLKARETPDIRNKMFALNVDRAGFVAAYMGTANRRCEIVDTIEYVSSAGSPMIVVLGTLTKARKAKPDGGALW